MAKSNNDEAMMVIEIGGNYWMLPFDGAIAVAKGLSTATQLDRDWGGGATTYKVKTQHIADINLKVLTVTELACIELSRE